VCGIDSANLEEGHGRGYGKQRNWFWRIAIGSARESKGWYWRAHHLLSDATLDDRLSLVDEIIALLVNELNRQQQIDHR
jgi:four helix bundle protein